MWPFGKTESVKIKEQEQGQLESRIEQMDKYPGSISDYNRFKDGNYVEMDTGRPLKIVQVETTDVDNDPEYNLLTRLINDGCTGFIHYVPAQHTYGHTVGGYGVPVRKKE